MSTTTSRHPDPVHPDLRWAARVLPRRLVRRRSLPVLRLADRLARNRARRGVEITDLPGGAAVRVHRPGVRDRAVPGVLWLHGGGQLFGTAAQDDAVCRHLADRLGAVVVAVDYRLAPEHPWPAGLDDAYEALEWVAGLPEVDAARLVVAGASAGGGMAASVALRARDREHPALAAQLLVYPMLDDRTDGSDPAHFPGRDPAVLRVWDAAANRFGWSAYLAGAGEADPEAAVPARAASLAGLPPTWIGVGTHDLFHGEDLAYAARLTAAGVPCQLEVVPGAFHGFDRLPTAVGRDFTESGCAFLEGVLGTAPR